MKDMTVYVTTHRTGKRTVRLRKFSDKELAASGATQEPAVLTWKVARRIADTWTRNG